MVSHMLLVLSHTSLISALFSVVRACCPHAACTALLLLRPLPAASMYFPVTFVARGELTGLSSCLTLPLAPNAEPSSGERKHHRHGTSIRAAEPHVRPSVVTAPPVRLVFVLCSCLSGEATVASRTTGASRPSGGYGVCLPASPSWCIEHRPCRCFPSPRWHRSLCLLVV